MKLLNGTFVSNFLEIALSYSLLVRFIMTWLKGRYRFNKPDGDHNTILVK